MCIIYLDYKKLGILDPMKKDEMKETTKFDKNQKVHKINSFIGKKILAFP